jgi:diguanylate cyclase (GGDEF)-like protein
LLGRYGKASYAIQISVKLEQAERMAERLRQIIKDRLFVLAGKKENITVSIGISTRTEAAQDFLSVLRCADIGLYQAKYGSGNSVRVNI